MLFVKVLETPESSIVSTWFSLTLDALIRISIVIGVDIRVTTFGYSAIKGLVVISSAFGIPSPS